MGFNIRHINKYWRWIKKTNAQYKENKIISKDYARRCLDLDIAILLNKPGDQMDKIAMRKHEWVLNYIEEKCSETIARYRNIQAPPNLYELNQDIKVWSMWWQGEENADKLFRMCIDSAKRHTGHEVITLSKDNYQKYFDIPEYILRKNKEGKIALQHICDLMVVSVMASEGGFFTGATVWWSQDKDEEFLRTPFFVCKAETERKMLMSRSRWVGYVMGGNKEFPLFSFTRDCLLEYWKKCDKAVDYLMMDYIFELAYRNIPCVKEVIDNVPDNNLLRNELINVLGNEYNPEQFKRYTEGDTFLYKLSWKFGNKDEQTVDGKETNYGHMLAECGDRL